MFNKAFFTLAFLLSSALAQEGQCVLKPKEQTVQVNRGQFIVVANSCPAGQVVADHSCGSDEVSFISTDLLINNDGIHGIRCKALNSASRARRITMSVDIACVDASEQFVRNNAKKFNNVPNKRTRTQTEICPAGQVLTGYTCHSSRSIFRFQSSGTKKDADGNDIGAFCKFKHDHRVGKRDVHLTTRIFCVDKELQEACPKQDEESCFDVETVGSCTKQFCGVSFRNSQWRRGDTKTFSKKCEPGQVLRDYSCFAGTDGLLGEGDVKADNRLSSYIVENNKAVGVNCVGLRTGDRFDESHSLSASLDCVDEDEFAHSFRSKSERHSRVGSGNIKQTFAGDCPAGQVRQSQDCGSTSSKFRLSEEFNVRNQFNCLVKHNQFFGFLTTTVTASAICMDPKARDACERK